MRLGKWAASLGLVGAICASAWFALPVPEFESVRARHRPSDAWLVDRHGIPLESVRTLRAHRSLEWVLLQEVSEIFRETLVRVEDRRFYSHPGVDPLALGNAIYGFARTGRARGASTLTMQLAGLLEDTNERRTVGRKMKTIFKALKLETRWSKEQILEAYVNLMPLRGELVGLRAASLGYFKKDPSALNDTEAAVLVAMLRSPNTSITQLASRACQVLDLKDCRPVVELTSSLFPYRLARKREAIPVISKTFVEGDWSSSIIRTSLDRKVQELALSAMREQLRELEKQNVKDGAVLVLESKTGRVVAYVGNAGSGATSAAQIDGVQARRQAGSTIKPFVYATALDWNLLKMNSLLEDTSADIPVGRGLVYRPRNYDQVFRGRVSAAEALASSINVPAVRVLELVGEDRILEKLRALGFSKLQSDEYYGPSLALGAVDVTLWELANAYRRFAIDAPPFSAETRRQVFDILSGTEYRRFTFGLNSLLSLPFPAAVKTGTSKDMRDNWCIGWTPEFTVAVWIGNFDGQPMWNVSGMSGAAPVWHSLMMALHPNSKAEPARYVAPAQALKTKSLSRIRYPADSMYVGLDPDIPRNLQKLPIEIENPQIDHTLFMNRKPLGRSQDTFLWPIQSGKHLIELRSAKGELVDSVRFQAR